MVTQSKNPIERLMFSMREHRRHWLRAIAVGLGSALVLFVTINFLLGPWCIRWYIRNKFGKETSRLVFQVPTYRSFEIDQNSAFYQSLSWIEHDRCRFGVPPTFKVEKITQSGRSVILKDELEDTMFLIIGGGTQGLSEASQSFEELGAKSNFELFHRCYWASEGFLMREDVPFLVAKGMMVSKFRVNGTITEFQIGDLQGFILTGERIIFEIFKDGNHVGTMGFAWRDGQLSEDEMATVVSTLACQANSP